MFKPNPYIFDFKSNKHSFIFSDEDVLRTTFLGYTKMNIAHFKPEGQTWEVLRSGFESTIYENK